MNVIKGNPRAMLLESDGQYIVEFFEEPDSENYSTVYLEDLDAALEFYKNVTEEKS